MQKSTITLDGVDYIVRTIDITSLPTFDGETYRSVDVADVALWDVLERRMEQGDKYAMRLDEKIFFYPDSEFIKADPTDEELLDYLRERLCQMTKYIPVRKPEEFDMYAIGGREGEEKRILLLGYTYKGDNWKVIDVRGVYMPLKEFVEGMEKNEDFVNELYQDSRQYERDVTDEECVKAINHYFDGDAADYRLQFNDVTIDTPVGNYLNS